MNRLIAIVVLIFILPSACKQDKNRTLLFVGSFTDKKPGKGIKVYDFDTKTAETKLLYEVDSITNSSFLRLAPNGRYLYSVIESQMEYNGKVAAFTIDSVNGSVTLLNMQDCGGRNPVHLEINKEGKYLVSSNYTDPGISLFTLGTDGRIEESTQSIRFEGSSIIKERQEGAHIHASYISPDGDFIFSQDLGSDKIHRNSVAKDGNGGFFLRKEGDIDMKPGSGPRHFSFHPNGKYAYGISELSGMLTAFIYKNKNLEFMDDYLTYSEEQSIYRAADIHISKDGKFLYVSNRGPDENTIAIFAIDQSNGRLQLVGHEPTGGDHPRNFAIDPSGNFLLVANQFSDNITIFRRNAETGRLNKLPVEVNVDNPSSIQIDNYFIK